MSQTRIPRLAIWLLASSIALAASLPTNNLFSPRDQAQCPANNNHCPQSTLPSNFCCPSGMNCLAVAGNTTVVCCPEGQDCKTITTIACQLDLQNVSLHPDSLIKTTALNGVLGHCGDGTCCPFGYSCSKAVAGRDAVCIMDANQNALPFQTTPPSTSTSAPPSSTASSSASSTASSIQVVPTTSTTTPTPGTVVGGSAGADQSQSPPATPSPSPSPGASGATPAVIAGTAVGVALLLAALGAIAFIVLKRRRTRRRYEEAENPKLTRSTSSFGNIISHPIVSENSTMRTDFVRKSPGGGRSSAGSAVSFDGAAGLPATPSPARMRDGPAVRIPPIRNMNGAGARQSSIAYGYGAPETGPFADGARGNATAGGGGKLPYPSTPPLQREPSSISINVFADPRTVTPGRERETRRLSHMTTFSEMLRSADLGDVTKGERYVPPGGTPGSRR